MAKDPWPRRSPLPPVISTSTTDQTLKPTTTIANQTKEERESGLKRERERESKIKTKRGIGSLNKERR